MSIERESNAAASLPALLLRSGELTQRLELIANLRDPSARTEAALQLGLSFPEIRTIGFLVELMQEDSQRFDDFLVLRLADQNDRATLQGLLDRVLADSDLLLTLRDVMPGSFPLPAGSPLDPLKARLRVLADFLDPLWLKVQRLGYEEQFKSLRELIDACRSFAFRVYVIGEWSSGKSTLINALLGQDLLPTGFVPVTPAPTHIGYGARPRLFLKRRDEPNESEHPIEVLRDLCLPSAGQETAAENARLLNLEHLRVELPAALCKNGIELVDTPGLNDTEQQNLLIAKFLPTADAVLLVLRATQPLTAAELDVLRQGLLQPEGLRRWLDAGFAVFSFTDVVLRDRKNQGSAEPLKRRAAALLRELNPPNGFASERQFWIDAQAALSSKLDQSDIENDSLKEFHRLEQSLQAFLAQGRGPQMEAGRREEAMQRLKWGVQVLEAERHSIQQGERLSAEKCQELEQEIREIDNRGRQLADCLRKDAAKFSRDRGVLLKNHVKELEPSLLAHMESVSYPGKVSIAPRKAAEHFALAGQEWLKKQVSDWSRDDLHPAMNHFLSPFIRDFKDLREKTGAIGNVLFLPKDIIDNLATNSVAQGSIDESVYGLSIISLLAGVLGLGVGAAISLALFFPAAIPIGLITGAVLGFLGFTSFGEDGRQGKLRAAVVKELMKQVSSEKSQNTFASGVESYFIKIAETIQSITIGSVRTLEEQLKIQRQNAELEVGQLKQRVEELEQTIHSFNYAVAHLSH